MSRKPSILITYVEEHPEVLHETSELTKMTPKIPEEPPRKKRGPKKASILPRALEQKENAA